jgi:hypothetical protein
MDTAETLLQESQTIAPLLGRPGAQPTLSYTIVRQRNGQVVEMPATEASGLEPGDTVKVEMTRPEGAAGKGVAVGIPPEARSNSSALALEGRGYGKF